VAEPLMDQRRGHIDYNCNRGHCHPVGARDDFHNRDARTG